MSDTPQGPGWWQATDGKFYPPESAPQQPGYGGPPPAPKKSGTSTAVIVLVVLFLVIGLPILGVVACSAFAFRAADSAGDRLEDAISEAEAADAEALTEVDCEVDPDATVSAGTVPVIVSADNSSSKTSDYQISVRILDGGLDVGSGFDIIRAVDPGEERSSSVSVSVTSEGTNGLACEVTAVDRSATAN